MKTLNIDNCGGCPHCIIIEEWDSQYCEIMENKYIDIEYEVAIPPWCPLPETEGI